MNGGNQATLVLLAFALVLSFVLMLVPLPPWAAMARPAFYPATVLYGALMAPRRFGVIAAWFSGLPLDVAFNTPLGQHALALALSAFVVFKMKDLLWNFPVWQQGVALLPVFALYEFTLFWIDGVNGRDVAPLWRWLPALSTAVIWPFWSILLERLATAEVNN